MPTVCPAPSRLFVPCVVRRRVTLHRAIGQVNIHDSGWRSYPLPPRDPPLSVGGELAATLARAEHALARLEVAGEMVPSLDWFIYAFVRKEAVISSQIEGTQATLIDLLEFEAEQATRVAVEDVHEVCNYLDAIKYARSQIKRSRGLPISIRLLNEAHRRLMRGVRGANKRPGEIRRSQNWIGGT
jgi:Fic family protein